MTGAGTGMTGNGKGKYRTAIILAVFAIGLFLFTIYNGLK
jgi:hypothetical protein